MRHIKGVSKVCHLAYLRKWLMDVFVQDVQGKFFHQFIFHQVMNLVPTQNISRKALIRFTPRRHSGVLD